MEVHRRFWVKYTAVLGMPAGVDASSPMISNFLTQLTDRFSAHTDLSQSAVMSPGDGRVLFTSVVEANSSDSALVKALHAYVECIEQVGGASNGLDSSNGHAHESITASIADAEGSPEVKELAGAVS